MSDQMTLDLDVTPFDRMCQYWQANRPEYLAHVRAIAVRLAARLGTITTDDLKAELRAVHTPLPEDLGWDKRMMGHVLSHCAQLEFVRRQPTTDTRRIKRAGVGASIYSVYRLRSEAA